MEPNSDQEIAETKTSENQTTSPENNSRDRRAFLRRAAIGVAGTAGLVATGASSARAESDAKSKILERIKAQMATQDQQREFATPGIYAKNAHALYLKS